VVAFFLSLPPVLFSLLAGLALLGGYPARPKAPKVPPPSRGIWFGVRVNRLVRVRYRQHALLPGALLYLRPRL
jgi:hypothetical protein